MALSSFPSVIQIPALHSAVQRTSAATTVERKWGRTGSIRHAQRERCQDLVHQLFHQVQRSSDLSKECSFHLLGQSLGFSNRYSKNKLVARASRKDYRSSDATGQKAEEPFRQAIFELEYMVKEPAEVLRGMQERLSARDLEIVLTYFAQEGRDSWCALEVYEWMHRENRVGDDTQKLMMTIMYNWVMKLVHGKQPVEEVKSLLQDMDCVGLKPEFHIMQSIISAYWDKDRKAEALSFVKEMLDSGLDTNGQDPVTFLLLKMVQAGEQKEALELIRHLRGCGFKLQGSTFSAALLAAIKEQEQFTKIQRQLKTYVSRGLIGKLKMHDLEALKAYEEGLHKEAEEIALWASEGELPDAMPDINKAAIYERLLAMYCIAGKALEAERALWQMKLAGRQPSIEMFNTIVGIYGFRNQREAALRIICRMEEVGPAPTKKTYSVLIGGLLKGGNYEEASHALHQMLDRALRPDPHVMLAVLRSLQKADLVTTYLGLCKTLAQVGMIEHCILYVYIDVVNLCIIRML